MCVRGELQEYQFALMIDDDVPLPPDLHVPNNTLNRNPAIKACAYGEFSIFTLLHRVARTVALFCMV